MLNSAPLIFFGLLQIIADYSRLFKIIPIDSRDTTIQIIANYSYSFLIIQIIRIILIIAKLWNYSMLVFPLTCGAAQVPDEDNIPHRTGSPFLTHILLVQHDSSNLTWRCCCMLWIIAIIASIPCIAIIEILFDYSDYCKPAIIWIIGIILFVI